MRHSLLLLLLYVWNTGNGASIDISTQDPTQLPLDVAAEGAQGFEYLNCDHQVTPVALIKNAGLAPLNSCKIAYRYDHEAERIYNWTGNMDPDESISVDLPPRRLAPGRHNFTFTVFAPNGLPDENDANGSYQSKTFYIAGTPPALPFELNFAGSESEEGYLLDYPKEEPTKWDIKTNINGYGRSGKCLSLNLSKTTGGDLYNLYLPVLDLNGVQMPRLSFQYAYCQLNRTNKDRLEVLVSTDCGMTWSTLWDQRGKDLATREPFGAFWFTPTKKEWRSAEIDLSALMNHPNVLIKFSVTGDHGNALYLDNITVGQAPEDALPDPKISIAPNPSGGACVITVSDAPAGEYLLKVLNSYGQIVYIEVAELSGATYTTALNINYLPSGKYPVVLCNSLGVVGKVHQLLVEK